MITTELKSDVDRIWDALLAGGITNQLELMEQINYLLFIRRLDDLHTAKEHRAVHAKAKIKDPIFPDGKDASGRSYHELRWSHFKDIEPGEMYSILSERVFPFLRSLDADGSTYSHHMRDARFTIPTPALLARVVDMLDDMPMEGRDVKGEVYEYMLSKLAAERKGQFRTPRHIVALMVEMTQPKPGDEICDPACGTAGFLVVSGEYIRRKYPEVQHNERARAHFHNSMFHGFDFDAMMLRIGSMNMLLHGVEKPDIRYRDSLSEEVGEEEELYSLILANPPFAGSLDYKTTAQQLLRVVKTMKTELLFIALSLRLLSPGGRAAVIVPDGVLFDSANASKALRRILVEDQKLDAIVKLPTGVFRPSGVSTAILLFTKTESGGTDHVWFYDVAADGWSLDDRREPLMEEDKLGPVPAAKLEVDDHEKNNLPDVLLRWAERAGAERYRARSEQSFSVPKAEIAANDYDLSLNRYKQTLYEEVEHRPPAEIIADIERLQEEIRSGLAELKGTVG